VSREKFKRHVSVMPLAALCLAGDRQSGKSAAANPETASCRTTVQTSFK
jgi:hypothetical protein